MFGVKARLSCTQKNYRCVKCEFVIEMIKGSPGGIVYHTSLKKNNRVVVRGSVELSNKKGECAQRYIKLFFFFFSNWIVALHYWRATALTSKCTRSLWEIAACDRPWCCPISWDKAGQGLRSSDQWVIMGSAGLWQTQPLPERDAYSCGLAAALPSNPSAASHQPAARPSR